MRKPLPSSRSMTLLAAAFLALPPAAWAQQAATQASPAPARRATAAAPVASAPARATLRPCESVTVDPPVTLALGKSQVMRLPFPAVRMVVGGQPTTRAGQPADAPPPGTNAPRQQQQQQAGADWDGVADADITLLSPTELYFLGRRPGSMNVVLQASNGQCVVKDLIVTVDPDTIQAKLAELMPEEKGVRVRAAERAVVLTGTVTDTIKLEQVLSVAASYGDGKKVVNLLRVSSPQQVMLEVKIAEVSKNILDHLDADFTRLFTTGSATKMISGIVGAGAAVFGRFHPNVSGTDLLGSAIGAVSGSSGAAQISGQPITRGGTLLGIDAQKKDGIVRILAEPNIMAISGQTASFLSGGKIFIPVAQDRTSGGVTITLEEKEFGVGLKFTPTVLDGSRINLKLVSESSELSQSGSPFTTINGITAILPSMATRRVDTTVQLNDGQSFVVAGLIKNNMSEALTKFPGLGEVPVMGALFRSTEFQNDQTELMFVVTPRLVKPITTPVALPTDSHTMPTRNDVMLQGASEGAAPAAPAETRP
jgi:pilus assembly protein CpaC